MAMESVPEEHYMNIKVTQVIDPSNFSAQIGYDISQLEAWEKKLHEYCECLYEVGCDVSQLHVGQLVLVHSGIDNTWKRAEIARVNRANDDIDVLHIDYGTTEILFVDDVYDKVPEEFAEPAPFAFRCRLAGVKPIASSWISRATQTFSKLVFNKTLSAIWLDYQEDVASVAIILSQDEFGQKKSVAQVLVDEEVAVAIENLSLSNKDSVQTKKEAVQKAHRIPGFKLEMLAPKKFKDEESEESDNEETVKADPEIEIMKAGLGDTDWEQSDLTIAKGYCPETNINIMENIRSEIRGIRGEKKMEQKFKGRGTRFPTLSPSKENPPGNPDRMKLSPEMPIKHKAARSPLHYPNFDNKSHTNRNPSAGLKNTERQQRSSIQKEERKGQLSQQDPRSKEKLKNEYEWQKYQFSRKVKQVVAKVTAENIEAKILELKELVFPVNSFLKNLPGPKELHLFMEVVLEQCIEQYDSFCKLGFTLLKEFQALPDFSSSMKELVWKLQNEYVKTAVNDEVLPTVTSYCQVLGEIYCYEWDNSVSEVISKCLVNSLLKWIHFNKKRQHFEPGALESLHLHCAFKVLCIAGPKMDQELSSDMEILFHELKEKVLSQELKRTDKEKCLDLLLLRASKWGQKNSESRQTKSQEQTKDDTIEVQSESSASLTGEDVLVEDLFDEDAGSDKDIKGQPDQDTGDDQEESDQYREVKNMLHELQLEDLLENFEANGIRDSILHIDLVDLKPLMKECGFKPGFILEIGKYLERKEKVNLLCVAGGDLKEIGEGQPNITGKIKKEPKTKVAAKKNITAKSPLKDFRGGKSLITQKLDGCEKVQSPAELTVGQKQISVDQESKEVTLGMKNVANWIRNTPGHLGPTDTEKKNLDTGSNRNTGNCDLKTVPKYVPPHLRITEKNKNNTLKSSSPREERSILNSDNDETYNFSKSLTDTDEAEPQCKKESWEIKPKGVWQATGDLSIHNVCNTESWPTLADSKTVAKPIGHKFVEFPKVIQAVEKPAAKTSFGQFGAPRACTLCKSPTHQTYDCPNTDRLFL
ncbi:uncharacterized protein LOC106159549 isoform X2 [Lingula anatina]|uniref:Uncharacterized protein LOC106159549 isoform X1 n=1 Tax=Lingula anatina TaxID=7574 RepID=A0A1S3I071_LINAN|nr:uncharacterized protein LOC106159549 isoform X1 [Lingula anatina]XP_013391419.1 uncharacterized protein LOC106159549 isoform X1 [Lingula anatina]XP_013391510.1 uncharacterized protein LOC106159549 isoform X1 [Lingula anatina]XP_013391586.1 uncharacterized protein LOC106159549 isoform X2 [Lingula anatina]XP_013391660.1 uncharacterized protein LOC106159549 isoform X2 [Lingula anatina]|eukprot:XP_013391347.1 uncharacterized protein LOC106159549 isoform X1 [Lingula anatina]